MARPKTALRHARAGEPFCGSRTPIAGPLPTFPACGERSEGAPGPSLCAAGVAMRESFGFGIAQANDLIENMVQRRTFSLA